MVTTSSKHGAFAPTLMTKLAPVGIRTAVKRGEKAYRYRYLRLDARLFPEVANARRIRLLIAPPDFSAPLVLITARLIKRGLYVQGFTVDAAYQRVIERYARDGYVAVLFIEPIEFEKEAGTPRS
jgi:hypothetical protein